MDLQELATLGKQAIDFVRGGVDLVQKLRELAKRPDKAGIPPAEVAELTLQLQHKLIDAQTTQLALLGALGELEGKMEQTERRLELHRRYETWQTAAGTLVLRLKPAEAGGEPDQCICPHCAEQGRRSFLQPRGTGKTCHACDRFFAFAPEATGARIGPV